LRRRVDEQGDFPFVARKRDHLAVDVADFEVERAFGGRGVGGRDSNSGDGEQAEGERKSGTFHHDISPRTGYEPSNNNGSGRVPGTNLWSDDTLFAASPPVFRP
jgi:hypothetical protein